MKLMFIVSVTILFPNGILFKGYKRLKSQEDTDKLYNIKHDRSVNNICVDELIRNKYVRYTDHKTSLGFNIAFWDNTCKHVSSEIRKKEHRVCEHECGERERESDMPWIY